MYSTLLRPAYIDEARFIVQAPIFSELLQQHKPAGRCLNAGCGQMIYLDWLDAVPGLTQFVHMDLETPVAKAVLGNPRHEATPGSVTALPFPNGSFELVFCTEVLEHVPDHHTAVQEISRVLTSEGLALISTPTPPAPFDPNHVREGYTSEEMTALLSAHGLKVLEVRYTFFALFRALYLTWNGLARLRGGISAFPRFALRGWSHMERMLPFGRPWDLIVIARKSS